MPHVSQPAPTGFHVESRVPPKSRFRNPQIDFGFTACEPVMMIGKYSRLSARLQDTISRKERIECR